MTKTRAGNGEGMRSPILTFQDMYDFMTDKELTRQGHQDDVWLLAEGLIDGKVVASHKVLPARRPAKIVLKLDNENVPLKADGSDFVTVIASITDSQGNVKRLNNQHIRFFVEGEGQLIGDTVMTVNPAPVIWGTAPVLVRSTMKPGKIKVTATVMLEESTLLSKANLNLRAFRLMSKQYIPRPKLRNCPQRAPLAATRRMIPKMT